MKPKKIHVILIAVLLLLVLFLPIPGQVYKDGGTRTYNALTYKIVVWNRLTGVEDEVYHKTSVYWLPYNNLSIDELWEMECASM